MGIAAYRIRARVVHEVWEDVKLGRLPAPDGPATLGLVWQELERRLWPRRWERRAAEEWERMLREVGADEMGSGGDVPGRGHFGG